MMAHHFSIRASLLAVLTFASIDVLVQSNSNDESSLRGRLLLNGNDHAHHHRSSNSTKDMLHPPKCCEDTRKWSDYPGRVRCASPGRDCCIAMCDYHDEVSYAPPCCTQKDTTDYVGRVRCDDVGGCCTALCHAFPIDDHDNKDKVCNHTFADAVIPGGHQFEEDVNLEPFAVHSTGVLLDQGLIMLGNALCLIDHVTCSSSASSGGGSVTLQLRKGVDRASVDIFIQIGAGLIVDGDKFGSCSFQHQMIPEDDDTEDGFLIIERISSAGPDTAVISGRPVQFFEVFKELHISILPLSQDVKFGSINFQQDIQEGGSLTINSALPKALETRVSTKFDYSMATRLLEVECALQYGYSLLQEVEFDEQHDGDSNLNLEVPLLGSQTNNWTIPVFGVPLRLLLGLDMTFVASVQVTPGFGLSLNYTTVMQDANASWYVALDTNDPSNVTSRYTHTKPHQDWVAPTRPKTNPLPTQPTPAPLPKSLLDNATVTLDSRFRWARGGLPENVIDGDPSHEQFRIHPSTHLGHCVYNPDLAPYIQIDLGEVKMVSGITIWHYWGDFRQYCSQSLKVSVDGDVWTEIYNIGPNWGPYENQNGHEFDLGHTPVRYIRHHAGPSNVNQAVHFLQVEVWGVDLEDIPKTFNANTSFPFDVWVDDNNVTDLHGFIGFEPTLSISLFNMLQLDMESRLGTFLGPGFLMRKPHPAIVDFSPDVEYHGICEQSHHFQANLSAGVKEVEMSATVNWLQGATTYKQPIADAEYLAAMLFLCGVSSADALPPCFADNGEPGIETNDCGCIDPSIEVCCGDSQKHIGACPCEIPGGTFCAGQGMACCPGMTATTQGHCYMESVECCESIEGKQCQDGSCSNGLCCEEDRCENGGDCCEGGLECDQSRGYCIDESSCLANSDCPDGMKCDHTRGYCIDKGACLANSDCPDGMWCDHPICLPGCVELCSDGSCRDAAGCCPGDDLCCDPDGPPSECACDGAPCFEYAVFGPHLRTFDGFQYDCQSGGEFVLTRSLASSFEVQGRWQQGMLIDGLVMTGIAVRDSAGGVVVEISISFGVETILVNAVRIDTSALFNYNGTTVTRLTPQTSYRIFHGRTNTPQSAYGIFQEDDGFAVYVQITYDRFSGDYSLDVRVRIPLRQSNEVIMGLMGTPDGDYRNDMMDEQGQTLPQLTARGLSPQNTTSYCQQYWCIRHEGDSLFTHDDSGDFGRISKCDEDDQYRPSSTWSQELGCICGEEDQACLWAGHNYPWIEAHQAETAQMIMEAQGPIFQSTGIVRFSPSIVEVGKETNVTVIIDLREDTSSRNSAESFLLYLVDMATGISDPRPATLHAATSFNGDTRDKIFFGEVQIKSDTVGMSYGFQAVPIIGASPINDLALQSNDAIHSFFSTNKNCDDSDPCTVDKVLIQYSAMCEPNETCNHNTKQCELSERCDPDDGHCKNPFT